MIKNAACTWFALSLLLAGCSRFDPHVGALQATCGSSKGNEQQTPRDPGYPGGSRAPAPAVPTCQADGGSACNDCENLHCCATLSACYGDPVCGCADSALDQCLDAAEQAADAAEQIGRCWSNFARHGSVEQDRVACQDAWCKAECEVP
jgi:hypothetical protein